MAARGKQFEHCFEKSVPKEFVCYRLKDAPKDFNNPNLKFSPSNIADFIIGNPHTAKMHFVELKETKEASLSFNNINWVHSEKMIEKERVGFCECYYLIRFSDKRSGTYAISVPNAINYRKEQMASDKPKKSFAFDWVVENGIEIPEKKLLTNYKLDITKVFGKGDDF